MWTNNSDGSVSASVLWCQACYEGPLEGPPCPLCNGTGFVNATLAEIEIYGWASEPEPRGPRPKIQHMMLFCPRCSMTSKEHVRHYAAKAIAGLDPGPVYGKPFIEMEGLDEFQREKNRMLARKLDRYR